ncbi:MAG: hypothetical protein CMO80_22845 [Verrucomicrobiales bacterium]|nr:hypothetical protein [Verrucomicrobiales bacterium]
MRAQTQQRRKHARLHRLRRPSLFRTLQQETQVGKGRRVVYGEKELHEKIGRNDLCPCGSGRRFKRCCMGSGEFDGSPRDDCF